MTHARALGHIETIVIGASAGGIEALTVILSALPENFGPAVLVVQHLPRGRESLLSEIFKSRCALPVSDAFDKSPIAKGTVTFAPADYHLLVDQEVGPHVALSVDAPVHFSRPSIDVLFESAADVFKQRLMGIVLTGANADGAEGLMAIRKHGGLTVVQDPESAAYPAMPMAAIALQQPDFVLNASAVGQLLKTMKGDVSPRAERT